MPHSIATAGFKRSWLLAGTAATLLSVVVLGVAALAMGRPFWMPLNATSHALHGPEAGQFAGIDLAHTGVGMAIHVAACFFWAAVAVLMLRAAKRGSPTLAWAAGLATAALAGVVDYALMPARLTPGWELVLPAAGVMAGLAAMGVGIALGLRAARVPDSPAHLHPTPLPTVADQPGIVHKD